MAVSFGKLLEAFEMASIGDAAIIEAVYLDRQSGLIYLQSDYSEEPEDQLPDDIEDGTKYIQVPNKRDLDLGTRLVFAFVREALPNDYDDVRNFFSRKGGYRKFRALVERRRVLERWYKFEQEATHRALREWCDANEIEVTD